LVVAGFSQFSQSGQSNPVESFTAHHASMPDSVFLSTVHSLISLSGENAMHYSPFGRSIYSEWTLRKNMLTMARISPPSLPLSLPHSHGDDRYGQHDPCTCDVLNHPVPWSPCRAGKADNVFVFSSVG
jgi:hypothetical protein